MPAKRIRVAKNERLQVPVLVEGDVVEFKMTYHVQVEQGIEAWVGYGVVSQVQEGESAQEADRRIRDHVEHTVDQRVRRAIERA